MFIFLGILCSILLGYLLGSISNGVLIGKIFFNVDVRTLGSHNSGGTNTGRVLGKKVGLVVIILDALKTMLAIWITYFILQIPLLKHAVEINPSYLAYIAGFSSCIGHTFPIFFSFKGGKSVACLAGICLATNWIISIIGITTFLIIVLISKYVSLGSILTSLAIIGYSFIPFVAQYGMIFSLKADIFYSILFVCVFILLTLRHLSNIKRILHGNENKIHWFSK